MLLDNEAQHAPVVPLDEPDRRERAAIAAITNLDHAA
ncbi:hypothetical protein P3T22_003779 [Paraburkholderia sp. GAS348]